MTDNNIVFNKEAKEYVPKKKKQEDEKSIVTTSTSNPQSIPSKTQENVVDGEDDKENQKNIQFNLSAEFTKKHWFDPNEHSFFVVEGMFIVNKIKINDSNAIPKEKRFDTKKSMETQVFNDEGLKWSDVNIIKK